MKQEVSAGAIVLKDNHVLMIHSIYGHWSFPKGHVEGNETLQETALREVKEETNIDIKLLPYEPVKQTYSPKKGVIKDVYYFVAEYTGSEISHQVEETSEAKWVSIDEVMDLLTFDSDKNNFLSLMLAVGKH